MENEPIFFTPLKDFESEEFRGSQYQVGLSYQAREEDAKLRALLPTWIKEGKVRLGLPEGVGKSSVNGVGVVSDRETMYVGAGDVGAGDVGTLKL